MPVSGDVERYDVELLRRIENLIRSFHRLVRDAEGQENEPALLYGLRALVSLANMVIRKDDVFGIEPWHVISDEDSSPASPGEMLLRLKDYKGGHMPPYPAIMAFYEHGYTADIDGILFLAALEQFQRGSENQVSINISARSLRDPDFVKCTLGRLESLELESDQKIIIEIHESTPHLTMSRHVLELYRNVGVAFAIDDVGLNMSDIMRLGEFEGLVDYLKIDRHTVCAPEESSHSLEQVVAFVRTLIPDAVMVAEGVGDASHALDIQRKFPDIIYMQGLYLPSDQAAFSREIRQVRSAGREAALS